MQGLGEIDADAPLLLEIGDAQFALQQLPAAENALRLSLMALDHVPTRMRLADVLMEQNCHEEALDEYLHVLENCDEDEDREKASATILTLQQILGLK